MRRYDSLSVPLPSKQLNPGCGWNHAPLNGFSDLRRLIALHMKDSASTDKNKVGELELPKIGSSSIDEIIGLVKQLPQNDKLLDSGRKIQSDRIELESEIEFTKNMAFINAARNVQSHSIKVDDLEIRALTTKEVAIDEEELELTQKVLKEAENLHETRQHNYELCTWASWVFVFAWMDARLGRKDHGSGRKWRRIKIGNYEICFSGPAILDPRPLLLVLFRAPSHPPRLSSYTPASNTSASSPPFRRE